MKPLWMLKYACDDDGPASNSKARYLDDPAQSRPVHIRNIDVARQESRCPSAHILWVDDEPNVLAIGRDMLVHLGHRVTTASNGAAALEIFAAHPDDFDLVITDEQMPDLTGHQLIGKLVALRPGLPVILSTGYGDEAAADGPPSNHPPMTIGKPFNLGELAAAISLELRHKH